MKIYETAKISERTDLTDCHPNTFIGDFCFISCAKLVMGEGSHINRFVEIQGRGEVRIGKYSVIGTGSKLITSTDSWDSYMSDLASDDVRRVKTGDIKICDHVYIGPNVIIMPNVFVGEGAVIGANAYIDKPIKPWTIYIPYQSLQIFARKVNSRLPFQEEEFL